MYRNRQFEHGFIALLAGLLVVAVAAPVIAAEREVKESGPASAEGMVMVENVSGSVKVIGWDKNEISLEGTLSGDIEELKFETGKKKSRIKVVWPKRQEEPEGRGPPGDQRAPRAASWRWSASAPTSRFPRSPGRSEASSISGDVTVTGECEEVEAESISGDVFIDGGAPRDRDRQHQRQGEGPWRKSARWRPRPSAAASIWTSTSTWA